MTALRPRARLLLLSIPLSLLLAVLIPAGRASADGNPWQLLETLREALHADGPLTARFVQTYVPAGFDSGDRENGNLFLWLPKCLRWSYQEGRSFLVCGGEVHQWNEDEPAGRVFAVDPSEEAGLDLLLLEVDTLRERYVASGETVGGASVIDLSMPPGQGSYRARITLDAAGARVAAFEYTDDEGNRTRFDLEGYQQLGHVGLFLPPVGLEWARD